MYSESERSWIAWVFVVILLFCGGCYAFWARALVAADWDPRAVIPFVVTLVLTVVILSSLIWSTSRYFVRDDGFGLQFGFTGWSNRFDYSEMTEAKEVVIRWTDWGGFGWRWRPGSIGYIMRNGRGVQIATTRSSRSYTFNCRDCDALLTALGEAGVPITSSSPSQGNSRGGVAE